MHSLATILDGLDRPFQIDRVPQYDGGRHQVEAGGTVALVLKAAVAHLAEAVEKHGPGQRIGLNLAKVPKTAKQLPLGESGGSQMHCPNALDLAAAAPGQLCGLLDGLAGGA